MEGLYLLYGEDLFLLEDALKKIKKSFSQLIEGINLIKIDETNVNQIIANIETPCFGFDKKLILVRNSGLLKKEGKKKNTSMSNLIENVSEYLSNNIDTIKQDNVIVFIEEEIEKNKLYKTIEQYGKVCNFEPEKLPNLIKRIQSIAAAYKVNISEYDAKYLVECCRN